MAALYLFICHIYENTTANRDTPRHGETETHNPKVVGSNPAPATNNTVPDLRNGQGFLLRGIFRPKKFTPRPDFGHFEGGPGAVGNAASRPLLSFHEITARGNSGGMFSRCRAVSGVSRHQRGESRSQPASLHRGRFESAIRPILPCPKASQACSEDVLTGAAATARQGRLPSGIPRTRRRSTRCRGVMPPRRGRRSSRPAGNGIRLKPRGRRSCCRSP